MAIADVFGTRRNGEVYAQDDSEALLALAQEVVWHSMPYGTTRPPSELVLSKLDELPTGFVMLVGLFTAASALNLIGIRVK